MLDVGDFVLLGDLTGGCEGDFAGVFVLGFAGAYGDFVGGGCEGALVVGALLGGRVFFAGLLGLFVCFVGIGVGFVGRLDGCDVGCDVGDPDGCIEGCREGCLEGGDEGCREGCLEG